MWGWVVGGLVVLLLVICGVGAGIAMVVSSSEESSSTSSTSESTSSSSSEPTTSEPTTSEPTTSEPTTSSSSSTPATPPSQSVPPTPAGSSPNTDSSVKLSASKLEAEVARGMSGYGHSEADISCSEDLVMIEGRTTSCTAPKLSGSGTSDVEVEVAWAVKQGANVSYYLTFRQRDAY